MMTGCRSIRHDHSVAEALVVAFAMIMGDEFTDSSSQRAFTKKDLSYPGNLLNTRDKPLCGQELCREQWVAIMNEVALASEDTVNGVGHIPADLAHPEAICERLRRPTRSAQAIGRATGD